MLRPTHNRKLVKINVVASERSKRTQQANAASEQQQNIQEGYEQVSNEKSYYPLTQPTVSETAKKVKTIVNILFTKEHIDNMTYKWLNSGEKTT